MYALSAFLSVSHNDWSAATGGTVDVTAHEILSRERIREIHHAVGGAAGGTAVDKAFEDMMARLLGVVVLAR